MHLDLLTCPILIGSNQHKLFSWIGVEHRTSMTFLLLYIRESLMKTEKGVTTKDLNLNLNLVMPHVETNNKNKTPLLSPLSSEL